MNECCHEYEDALAILSEIRKAVPAHLVQWVDYLIQFTQDNFDFHVNQAGEAAWND
ncbi:hypothetical protein LCGC14_2703850 [marine sediment metagenome]|uniref:Uncharacterized protein n=1 Tax=marine sediment metagenome TaxID=412755 RepID=A0A0F9BP39_9ZZZZ